MGTTADPTVPARRELMAAVLAAAGVRTGACVLDLSPEAGFTRAASAMAGGEAELHPWSGGPLPWADDYATHVLYCPAAAGDGCGIGVAEAAELARVVVPGGRVLLLAAAEMLDEAALRAAGFAVRYDEVLTRDGGAIRLVAAVHAVRT